MVADAGRVIRRACHQVETVALLGLFFSGLLYDMLHLLEEIVIIAK